MRPSRTHDRRLVRALAPAAVGLITVLVTAGLPAEAADNDGFLYGRIETESGSKFEGQLRWGSEEAFWGDLFNGTKKSLPHSDRMPKSNRKKKEKIRVFGINIGVRFSDYEISRAFKARFGDIARIEVEGDDRATLTMKSGSEFEVAGGSNDLGGKVRVWDPGIGEVEIDWDRIRTIEFLPVKRGLKVGAHRLHGNVYTTAGEFRGFIQWDQDECLSTDKLDGDSEDAEMSIEMGRIRSIERRRSDSSRVVLFDDREFVLEDSNDVDSDNRGIFIEDDRYGRVLVPWDEFDRVEFSGPGSSGPAYDDFKPAKQLRGVVKTVDGDRHRGQLIYDLDESETWEFFDGNRRDIEYSIPFGMIAAVIPRSDDSVRVVLRSEETLVLEDSADTGDGSAGVLVLRGDDDEVHVRWDDVDRVDFEH